MLWHIRKDIWEKGCREMLEFIMKYTEEILVGLFTTFLGSVILYWWGKRYSFHPFLYHKSKKRLKEAGIVTFFYDRKVLQKDAGTIGDYVNKAQMEVYYVGCWLSSSLNSLDLSNAILERAKCGVKFYFCVISPDSVLIDKYSEFFNESRDELINKLIGTLHMLFRIKSDLPIEYRKNVKIFIHDQIVTTSFWAIDPEDEKKALLQLDHKIIKNMRFNSYGMEIRVSKKSRFAEEVKKGYFSVIEGATELKENIASD